MGSGTSRERSRPTVRLLLACNNRCIFCSQEGVLSPSDEPIRAALERARKASDEVTFVGGEPLLDESLEGHVSLARGLGFTRIGVQSNGSRLGHGEALERLKAAGLTDVHLSIHGSDPAVHDYHSGRAGSLDETASALEAARTLALPVVVTSVLTKSSFRVLASLPPLLAVHEVKAWRIAVPVLAGRALSQVDRVAPRLGLAIPFALHAVSRGRELGVESWISGAPYCLLGPYVSRALPDAPRAYGAPCEACPARPACPGVDAHYLARFGGDELRRLDAAVADTPSTWLEAERTLAAMFVGEGEVAPAPSPIAHPATERGRRALPMLGKVKPALAEVAPGGEKKTGEALKEILPSLFKEAPKG